MNKPLEPSLDSIVFRPLINPTFNPFDTNPESQQNDRITNKKTEKLATLKILDGDIVELTQEDVKLNNPMATKSLSMGP